MRVLGANARYRLEQSQTLRQENRVINGYGNYDTGAQRHRRNARYLIAQGPSLNDRTRTLRWGNMCLQYGFR